MNKQIGWSVEANLLADIIKELDRLIKVTSTSGGGGGSSYTFTNGITDTLGTVKLGGLLIEDTILTRDDGLGKTAVISISSARLDIYTEASDNSNLPVTLGSANTFTNESVTLELGSGAGSFRLIDSRAVPTGLEYLSDYSGNYTLRSLTDKEYVDTAVSDKRLKKNIKKLPSQLEKVIKFNPVQFTWKKDNSSDIGFIAQDIQKIDPSFISNEGKYLKIKKHPFIPMLVKAIQEQQVQIEKLNKEIEKLKNK